MVKRGGFAFYDSEVFRVMQAIPTGNGLNLPVSNLIPTLLDTAHRHLSLGWSVIPLRRQSKAAGVAWSIYQHRLPTGDELAAWFNSSEYGLAIVTGRVSRLAVLDFDSLKQYDTFKAELPHLAHTYAVRTRRGLHLYYRTPAGVFVPSRKAAGADWKGEGGYVVAPPTCINGHLYERCNSLPARELSQDELRQIEHFLCVPPMQECIPTTGAAAPEDAVATYRQRVHRLGSRNTALYHTARTLKQVGQGEQQVIAALAVVHAQEPPSGPHRAESFEQRYTEAIRTIASAFKSRWYFPSAESNQTIAVDQALREHLLQRNKVEGTAFLRVYEGLLMQGVQPDAVLSYAQLYRTLAGLGIGRRAIQHALTASTPDGRRLLQPLAPTTPHPSQAEVIGMHSYKPLEEQPETPNGVPAPKCTRIGRLAKRYRIPSIAELCDWLGVTPAGGSDAITAADLASPSHYRQALQREFIRRYPGRYSLGLLAQRLSVSKRTLLRYHQNASICSLPTYDTLTEIGWLNLDEIPAWKRGAPSRYCLEDRGGRRYPARRPTAEWLLGRGRRLWLRQRGYNYYWLGEPPVRDIARTLIASSPAAHSLPAFLTEQRVERLQAHLQTAIEQGKTLQELSLNQLERLCRQPTPPERQLRLLDAPAKPPKPPKVRRKTDRYYQRPLPDSGQERLAERVHAYTNPERYTDHELQTLLGNVPPQSTNRRGLSLVNARKLVDTYGVEAVNRTLNKALWMERTLGAGRITSPAGFLILASRVEWRRLNPQALRTPQFRPVQTRKRRQYNPELDAYWCYLRDLLLWHESEYQTWRAAFFASIGILTDSTELEFYEDISPGTLLEQEYF
jgi:hypothetical protein